MNPVAIAFTVCVPAAFIAGVYFSKSALREAFQVKQHVSDELSSVSRKVAELPADVASLLGKAAKKL